MVATDVIIEESDIPYEEDILRDKYNVKTWLRYLDKKRKGSRTARWKVYERAVKQIPKSYKIWYSYLTERVHAVRNLSPIDPARIEVNSCFERALVHLNKMPRIWIMYLEFQMEQHTITTIRHAFDNALRSLAITQHYRIWPMYLAFVKEYDIPETGVRVYRRYLQVEPNDAEEFVDYLISIDRLDDAAVQLIKVLNKERFAAKSGKTRHQLWIDLCTLISKNPGKITSVKVEAIIRSGLRKFTDMIGTLWNALADYHIRRGNFEKARDIFEEAIQTTSTVRDFSTVFEAYSEFEENSITARMDGDGDVETDEIDLELRMARYESLIERRPMLLSSVLLRQNPHNVEEWHKRVGLQDGDVTKMISVYTEAVQTIDPQLSTGQPSTIWIGFARVYEDNGDLTEAREIFERAVQSNFRTIEDLADVWCAYAEMETRAKEYQRSLKVLKRATAVPPRNKIVEYGHQVPVQMRVHKSLKLWSLYADLQESFGTFEATKGVYDYILDLRIATPQVVINYATFLEEHDYFELAFAAYERGIALFKWPVVYEIWNCYLVKFIKRYEGTKIERVRELFEQAVDKCTPKFAKKVYLLYASYEEKYGLARHAMAVYERSTKAVLPAERLEMWETCIRQASKIFGVTYTRELYQKAIESLPDKSARKICESFANMERQLGEIDRARSIYSHGSQFADPRSQESYWKTWHDFEVRHGNADTFREMLRIKRSVAALYNTSTNYSALDAVVEGTVIPATGDSMADLASQTEKARELQAKQFVKAGDSAAATANTDEIVVDMDDSDDDDDKGGDNTEKANEPELVQMDVPDTVFGGIVGAKARFEARKQ